MIMANSEYFKFMKTLVENEEFLAVTGVTQDQKEKQKRSGDPPLPLGLVLAPYCPC